MCELALDITSIISGHWSFSETPTDTRSRRGAASFCMFGSSTAKVSLTVKAVTCGSINALFSGGPRHSLVASGSVDGDDQREE